jgi:Protein of unknown function (DUF2971)
VQRIPPYLYKYEAFSAQVLENLKAQRIYFGSPRGFNDPYDCATNPVVSKPSAEEAEQIRQHYLDNANHLDQPRHAFADIPVEVLRQKLQSAGASAFDSAVAQFLRERGVSCFSECNDDLVMWGHYGGKYKGLCLEFSTAFEPFSKARPVSYCGRIPQVSVIPYLIEGAHDPVDDLFCMKSASWAYEREWRVFHKQLGTLYHYDAGALTGVYFGPEASDEAVEIVALILRGQNPGVRLHKGERSRAEYKVSFSEFKYFTYLEAKNMGQR